MSRWKCIDNALYLRDDVDTELWPIPEDAPTIEIIHCRECKWFDSKGHCMRLTAEYGTYEDVRTDDFCSYGSRSEKPNNSTISKMEQLGKE